MVCIVGLELEEFLQDGEAQHLAVVDFRVGARPGEELAAPRVEPGLPQGVVECAVGDGHDVFEGETDSGRHGAASLQMAPRFTRSIYHKGF